MKLTENCRSKTLAGLHDVKIYPMLESMRRRLIILTRRAAQAVSLLILGLRSIFLLPFLLIGLLLYPGILQRDFYASHPRARWLRRHFPYFHFLGIGAWTLQDPHPRFSQTEILKDFPRLLLQPPILNHVLNFRAEIDFPLEKVAPLQRNERARKPSTQPGTELESLQKTPEPDQDDQNIWDVLRNDTREISKEVSSLTPTPSIERAIHNNRLPNEDYDVEGSAVVRLLKRFPERVDMLIVVPWLGIRGGAEKVLDRYFSIIRSRYEAERVCIFAPDQIYAHSSESEARIGIPIIAINDEMPAADQAARVRIFDRVMVNVRPARMHNSNSLTAWLASQEMGKYYTAHTKMFVNLFSDIRLTDQTPVGYYHNYFPFMLDAFDGVLCDNTTIAKNAVSDFGLTRRQTAKLHHVPTPILGLNGGNPRDDLRKFQPVKSRTALWMSRISPEKRLDIVEAISRRLPERRICVYGATLPVVTKIDMGWKRRPNIDYRGEFEHIRDIPLSEFDCFLFTSNGEGMPLAILEAVANGLPVIAPNVGGIGEMIDEETGWLVSGTEAVDEYVEALRQIEQNPEEARRRVERAQQRLVERHSLGSFIHALEGVPDYLQASDR